jgi:hypothetical protein
MTSTVLCKPYVWEQPAVLLQTPVFPATPLRCASEAVNHIVVVSALLGALAFASWRGTRSGLPVLMCFIAYVAIAGPSYAAYWKARSLRGVEAFQGAAAEAQEEAAEALDAALKARHSGAESPSVNVIGRNNSGISSQPIEGRTAPTARNPFMNVLIDEIKYNPGRPPAASVLDPSVKISLDDFFRTEFNRDPTDVFGRSQNQRQWVAMPSTSIPNDQDSYQNWLYRIPGKTCKEGGREACMPGTDGGALPWLNVDS